MARRRRQPAGDELTVEPAEALLLPPDFASGELRDASARPSRDADWARAKRAIERVCAAVAGRDVDVGFVKKVGSGLSRDAYLAELEDGPSPVVCALVPNRWADADYPERAATELRLLHALSGRTLPFRVPKALGALRDAGGASTGSTHASATRPTTSPS